DRPPGHPVDQVPHERPGEVRQPERREHDRGGGVGAGEVLHPDRDREVEGAVGEVGRDPRGQQPTERLVLPGGGATAEHGQGAHRASFVVGSGLTVAKSWTRRAPSGRAVGSASRPPNHSAATSWRCWLSLAVSSAVAQKVLVVTRLAWTQASSSSAIVAR